MEDRAIINLEILIPQRTAILTDTKVQELMKEVNQLRIDARELQKALNKRIEEIEE